MILINQDPLPDVPLDEIESLALRLECLIARSSSPLLHTDTARVVGMLPILQGLEYHATNFLDRISRMPEPYVYGLLQPATQHHAHAQHEAVAWLNRLGQLYTFIKSDFVTSRVSVPTPVTDSLINFRHKHSAHRSIDDPRPKTESAGEIENQAIMMSGFIATRKRRPGVKCSPWRNLHGAYYFKYTMRIGQQWPELIIETDHPKVMNEGFMTLETLLR